MFIKPHKNLKLLYSTKANEKNKWALLFPGQGSQSPGMGKDLYLNFKAAKLVFEEANEHLKFDVTKMIFESNKNVLMQTELAQPAIMTVSYAIYKVLKDHFNFNPAANARFVLGHSFGELTSILVSESLDFETSIKLARFRGLVMKDCINKIQKDTCMRALLLHIKNLDKVKEIVEKVNQFGNPVDIGSINTSTQIVLSGTRTGINKVIEQLFSHDIAVSTAVDLSVSGPFHSRLMTPAKRTFEKIIQKVKFNEPIIPILSNFTGNLVSLKNVPFIMSQQIDHTVRWYDSMLVCRNKSVDKFLCFGPSKVIENLLRKDFGDCDIRCLDTVSDFKNSANIELGQ